jgi:hypothetical protein
LSARAVTGARLLEDAGAAASGEQFFRCPEFLEAEGTSHTLIVEGDGSRVAIPLVVREIPGTAGERDASSPYSYPGGEVSGPPIDPASVDWSATGLVSVFVRDRLGAPTAFSGATERSVVLVSDPELPRKSRMSDRQQIRKNEADGYAVDSIPGPDAGLSLRRDFHRVYTETMRAVGAADRYLFAEGYFDLLFRSRQSRIFTVTAPEGDLAAAAIAVVSDGFLHYYLSGTADAHRGRAPSKNLIVAVTDHAERLGMPMNLGGGIEPGDGLEEFKRGFANRELPFRTHELICDRDRYTGLSAGLPEGSGFFPLYRASSAPS